MFAAEFAQVVGGLADGVDGVPVMAGTLAVSSATVKPSRATDSAGTPAIAARIRGLFGSRPPTRMAPIRAR